MTNPNRYRMEPLPGLEDQAEVRHWGPAPERTSKAEQGWIPFSDGSQLGPLFAASQQRQGKGL